MESEREHTEALVAAGHTGPLGAVVFCALLAVIGALVGSVALAIVLNVLVAGLSEGSATGAGAVAGAALGVALGLVKIARGNRDAAEHVEDRAWRRHLLRQRGVRVK